MDERTQKMELLQAGRIKVLLNKSVTLPQLVPVWVEVEWALMHWWRLEHH